MTLLLPISREIDSLKQLVCGNVVIVRNPIGVPGLLWCLVIENNSYEPPICMVAMSNKFVEKALHTNWCLMNAPEPWTSYLEPADHVELVAHEDVPTGFWVALARLKLTGNPTVF